MPRKIRQLIRDLNDAGFQLTTQKGSHRKFKHPDGPSVILSGAAGDDAARYQEQEIRAAIEEVFRD